MMLTLTIVLLPILSSSSSTIKSNTINATFDINKHWSCSDHPKSSDEIIVDFNIPLLPRSQLELLKSFAKEDPFARSWLERYMQQVHTAFQCNKITLRQEADNIKVIEDIRNNILVGVGQFNIDDTRHMLLFHMHPDVSDRNHSLQKMFQSVEKSGMRDLQNNIKRAGYQNNTVAYHDLLTALSVR